MSDPARLTGVLESKNSPKTIKNEMGKSMGSQIGSARNQNSARSLHLFKKKEETRRIERENLKIAQKIFSMKPSIRAKDQQDSYAYYHSISQRMRQIPTTRIHKGINSVESLLPPIKDATPNEEMMTTKENEGGEALEGAELPPIEKKTQEMTIDSSVDDLSKRQVYNIKEVKMVEPLRKKSTTVKQTSSLSNK